MNDHTLRVLEYPGLLELIASHAAAEPTREAIRARRPAVSPDAATRDRPFDEAFLALRRREVAIRRIEFDSPADALRRVAPRDAVLEIDDLLVLRLLMRQAGHARRFLANDTCRAWPVLADFAASLPNPAELLARLDRTFDAHDQIDDHATERLAEIRQRRRALERRIHQRLEHLLQEVGMEEVFFDKFVAIRNNRYVVPVKRELKSRLRGVVHDQSNSGRTIFMEPELTLEDGNELAALHLEERDEIRRLLALLSDLVRGQREELQTLCERLVRYDTAYAISAWADSYECTYPRLGNRLRLQRGRHPLLQHQFRNEQREAALVPLDLELDNGIAVLAITGSNTGGKTVVLKTVGLLTLAVQAGLPIPAGPDTELRYFPAVMADIGDEQSLVQSLSTFSAHLRNLSAIFEVAAEQPCLVLLDELGAGTDPIEGGALGCAILETLADSGALTLFTTHLGMIKNFVHERDDMLNARVRFNADTLAPEYALEVGQPGASHALSIAARCGLPADVLQRARSRLSPDQLNMEELLASIEQKERTIADELRSASDARDKAIAERDALRAELADLRRQRKQLLHSAQQEAGALVDNTRRQMESLLEKAKHAGRGEEAKALRQTIQRKQETIKQGLEQTAAKPPGRLKQGELVEGMRAWVPLLNDHGTIVSLSGDRQRAVIEVAGKRFELKTNQLTAKREEAASGAAESRTAVHIHRPSATPASLELNLIGLRVEQAIPKLERFLDNALLAGLEQVRIIHGFGTGQLRQGVHEYLAGSAVVLGYRLGLPDKDPGGSGATIVQLA